MHKDHIFAYSSIYILLPYCQNKAVMLKWLLLQCSFQSLTQYWSIKIKIGFYFIYLSESLKNGSNKQQIHGRTKKQNRYCCGVYSHFYFIATLKIGPFAISILISFYNMLTLCILSQRKLQYNCEFNFDMVNVYAVFFYATAFIK